MFKYPKRVLYSSKSNFSALKIFKIITDTFIIFIFFVTLNNRDWCMKQKLCHFECDLSAIFLTRERKREISVLTTNDFNKMWFNFAIISDCCALYCCVFKNSRGCSFFTKVYVCSCFMNFWYWLLFNMFLFWFKTG